MYTRLIIALVAVVLYHSEGRKLPSYIIPCQSTDPKLNDCAKQHALDAVPYILKGDKSFKTPPLSPLHLDLIDIYPSDTLSIKLTDITLSGLENAVIEDVNFDLKNKHISTRQSFSWVNIVCKYVIDGRILVLPISGNGPANLTFENLVVDYMFDYTLSKKKDGKEYIDHEIKPTVKYTVGKSSYHFENLFNGDKALGEHMNKFLNENSAEVTKDLGSSVSETISAVVTSILKTYLSIVPYNEIFLP